MAEEENVQQPTAEAEATLDDGHWDVGDGPADVGNDDEEENFEAGMQRNAQDYEAHDADQDNKLDFGEFCSLVRQREDVDFSDEDLRVRFEELDSDGSGKVDLSEYIRFSLRDALSRSSARVMDLFRQWDDDDSGEIDRKEFRQAVRALGFDFFDDVSEIDKVFDEFDLDGSGKLEYKELNKMLRHGAAIKLSAEMQVGGAGEIATASSNKHKLRKATERKRGSALPVSALLAANAEQSVQEQLQEILTKNAVRVIDLFREWDEDGNGSVSRKEFRMAIAALGYDAPHSEIDAVFDGFDEDGAAACTLRYATPRTPRYAALRHATPRPRPALRARVRVPHHWMLARAWAQATAISSCGSCGAR